ncbi:hypothetical protein ACH5RR_003649 [Cinchona calisaya]|uniref:Pectinesterase inhibitor domain-containing protein n=1 Tax=Cinchona calisaya TaxID=153742 RepID=A0ABD3AVV2_9GENT
MAYFGGVLYLLAGLLLGSLGVQGDESSYKEVCNKTGDYYYYCIDCFEKHQNNDLDYGGISINCTTDSALVVEKSVLEFSKNSTGKFQEAMNFCVEKVDAAAAHFAASLRCWREQRKEDTIEYIQYGRNNFTDCVYKLSPFNISVGFIRQLAAVTSYVQISIIIVSL